MEKYLMTKHQRFPSSMDANLPVPETLTNQLIQGIMLLPDQDLKTCYLKEQFLSKFVSDETDPPELRKARAIEKWLDTERRNGETNSRLLFLDEEYNILPRLSWLRFRDKCRSMVRSILGDAPSDEILVGSFSGGASTSRSRLVSFPANKYLGKADVTQSACSILWRVLPLMPGWLRFADNLDIEIVPGNVLFTVPKKTDIDRVACKEPDINMFLQKGVGRFIRTQLRKHGIDLNDQSKNRRLAELGSITHNLATLDLSSASDSVCVQLIAELFPPAWFHLLMDLRSPITLVNGEEHVNEMISSMGNGFTFELESLVFYVLTRATAYFEGVSGIISVYGDDIICPVEIAEQLSWVLHECGFLVNAEKSFSSGSFRESCGGHYNNGLDVTPFYLRRPVRTLTDLIHVCNSIRKWSSYRGSPINDCQAFPLWESLASLIPREFWGGRDYASIYQLVSPGSPRKMLVAKTKAKRLSPLQSDGTYIHWLNTTWDRSTEGDVVSTSSPSDTIHSYRSRPAPRAFVSSLPNMFLAEL